MGTLQYQDPEILNKIHLPGELERARRSASNTGFRNCHEQNLIKVNLIEVSFQRYKALLGNSNSSSGELIVLGKAEEFTIVELRSDI